MSCAHGKSQKKETRKTCGPMNLLFLLADDLRNHDLSCAGSLYYETPNIDRIQRRDDFYHWLCRLL